MLGLTGFWVAFELIDPSSPTSLTTAKTSDTRVHIMETSQLTIDKPDIMLATHRSSDPSPHWLHQKSVQTCTAPVGLYHPRTNPIPYTHRNLHQPLLLNIAHNPNLSSTTALTASISVLFSNMISYSLFTLLNCFLAILIRALEM